MGAFADKRDDALEEKVLSKEITYQGDFLTIERVNVALPNGKPAKREVVRHPGAAAIFAIDEDARVLIVRQYRTAFERIFTEIPAGRLEAGEDPKEAAIRELKEETGVVAQSVELMLTLATAAGFCDELLHVYLARGLTFGESKLDEDEFVSTEWVPYDDLLAAIKAGEVVDSKTIAATLFYEANFAR